MTTCPACGGQPCVCAFLAAHLPSSRQIEAMELTLHLLRFLHRHDPRPEDFDAQFLAGLRIRRD